MGFPYSPISGWPPLAWLARCSKSGKTIDVFHGSNVEITDNWFCEAVWDGDFKAGGFDSTDIIAGTGGRLREGKVVFVSSGSTVDRLHSLQDGSAVWISNSLPCLLSAVDATPPRNYPNYPRDFESIVQGDRLGISNLSPPPLVPSN